MVACEWVRSEDRERAVGWGDVCVGGRFGAFGRTEVSHFHSARTDLVRRTGPGRRVLRDISIVFSSRFGRECDLTCLNHSMRSFSLSLFLFLFPLPPSLSLHSPFSLLPLLTEHICIHRTHSISADRLEKAEAEREEEKEREREEGERRGGGGGGREREKGGLGAVVGR